MKRVFIPLALLLVAFGGGCASEKSAAGLAAGPAPGTIPALNAADHTGFLVVYSAHEVDPDINSRDEYRPHFTDYRILTMAGDVLQVVHNDSGTMMQRPARVRLNQGNYQVRAWANGRSLVTVPVVVAAQHVTVLNLDRDVNYVSRTRGASSIFTAIFGMPDEAGGGVY